MSALRMLDRQGMAEWHILTGGYPMVNRSKHPSFNPTHAMLVDLWKIPGGFSMGVIRAFAKEAKGKVVRRTNAANAKQIIFFQDSDDAMLFKLTWGES